MRRRSSWSRECAFKYNICAVHVLGTLLYRIQRLGVDITKAAESLRAWGVGEGDDLVVSDAFVWVYVVQLYFIPQKTSWDASHVL